MTGKAVWSEGGRDREGLVRGGVGRGTEGRLVRGRK